MPHTGLPPCTCEMVFGRTTSSDYWEVKQCKSYTWIQCRHCGEVRKTTARSYEVSFLERRPKDWKELVAKSPYKPIEHSGS